MAGISSGGNISVFRFFPTFGEIEVVLPLRESSQAQPKHRCLRTALGRHYSRSFGSTRKISQEIRLARGCFLFPKRPLWPDPMTTTSPTQASCCFKASHHNLRYSLEFFWSNLLRSWKTSSNITLGKASDASQPLLIATQITCQYVLSGVFDHIHPPITSVRLGFKALPSSFSMSSLRSR